MIFTPVIPSPGIAGWRFLERTYDAQLETHARDPTLTRETEIFRRDIGTIRTAADLVSNRTIMRVALGAFGLQDDINNRFFIQKVLEDGTSNSDALANRLSDRRYRQFSDAFGFGPGTGLQTADVPAMSRISEAYLTQSFAESVGRQSDDFRLALNLRAELPDIAQLTQEEDTKWFTIMGSPPLRAVFEVALGLPREVGTLDIDKQAALFSERLAAQLDGTQIADLSEPDMLDRLLTRFLARSQIQQTNVNTSSASIALTLLQSRSNFRLTQT